MATKPQSRREGRRRLTGSFNLGKPAVGRRIAASCLVIAATSLCAIAFALLSLHVHTQQIERIIKVDVRGQTLSRNLHSNIIARQTLARQFSILESDELLDLLQRRYRDFDSRWAEFGQLPDNQVAAEAAPMITISIAIAGSMNAEGASPEAISRECARMKSYLKNLPGSNYLIDRRSA